MTDGWCRNDTSSLFDHQAEVLREMRIATLTYNHNHNTYAYLNFRFVLQCVRGVLSNVPSHFFASLCIRIPSHSFCIPSHSFCIPSHPFASLRIPSHPFAFPLHSLFAFLLISSDPLQVRRRRPF